MEVTEVKLILSEYQHKLLDFAATKHGGLEQLKVAILQELITIDLTPEERARTKKMLQDVEDLIYMINGMAGSTSGEIIPLKKKLDSDFVA